MRFSILGSCRSPGMQSEIESGAAVHGALSPNPATVTLDDALDGSQSDAGTFEFSAGMQALKRTEQLMYVCRIETGAIILQEISVRTSLTGDSKLDAGSFFSAREFPGVLKQIHQDDTQQGGVTRHSYLRGYNALDAALGVARFQLGGDSARYLAQIHDLGMDFQPAYAREIQQVVDQLAHLLRGRTDAVQVQLSLLVELFGVLLFERVAEAVHAN